MITLKNILKVFCVLFLLNLYFGISLSFGQTENPNQKKQNTIPQISDKEIKTEINRQIEKVNQLRSLIKEDKSLRGWYFVINPGHGDNDPGTVRTKHRIDGTEVLYGESVITLDIARRLGWYLKQHGASGVYFTLGPSKVVALDANDEYSFWHQAMPPQLVMHLRTLLPAHPDAFTEDIKALSARSQVANQKVRKYGKDRVIYISIHVDSLSSKIGGMSFYQARGGRSKLIFTLKEVATQKGLVRTKEGHKGSYLAIVEQDFVEIIPKFNHASEALLIEVGNINNGDFDHGDFLRLITAQGREEIAQIIGLGLVKYCEKYP